MWPRWWLQERSCHIYYHSCTFVCTSSLVKAGLRLEEPVWYGGMKRRREAELWRAAWLIPSHTNCVCPFGLCQLDVLDQAGWRGEARVCFTWGAKINTLHPLSHPLVASRRTVMHKQHNDARTKHPQKSTSWHVRALSQVEAGLRVTFDAILLQTGPLNRTLLGLIRGI